MTLFIQNSQIHPKFDAALAHNVEILFLEEKASTIYIDTARNASRNALPMITY